MDARMSRRDFVRASAGTGVARYLGGCGGSSPALRPRTVRLPGGSSGFPSPCHRGDQHDEPFRQRDSVPPQGRDIGLAAVLTARLLTPSGGALTRPSSPLIALRLVTRWLPTTRSPTQRPLMC